MLLILDIKKLFLCDEILFCLLFFSYGINFNFVFPAIYVGQGHFSTANVANISVSH